MKTEELAFGETYDFKVIAQFGGTSVSGQLHLSCGKCSLILSGDISENRQVDVNWTDCDYVICTTNLTKYILLLGLTLTFASSTTLESHPKSIGGFEIRYDVESVVFSRVPISFDDVFSGLMVHSPAVNTWVGRTSTQSRIVDAYHDGTLLENTSKVEARHVIENLGAIQIDYPIETYYSEDFEAGLRFPPRISVFFNQDRSVRQILEILSQLKNFLSVIIGVPVLCTTVSLSSSYHRSFNNPTLYSKQSPPTKLTEWPLFPLGHNLHLDQLGLPPFPVESFEAFFNAGENVKNAFSKYVKYRSFVNPEEKFLGYFRIVEKLTADRESYVDGAKLAQLLARSEKFLDKFFGDRKSMRAFSKQIIRTNCSKLNTAACIRRFVKKIPIEVTDQWIYGNAEIDKICRLRNDLTHANDVEPNEIDLLKFAKFIEVLIVLALFEKIGIPIADLAKIISRLQGYHLIVEPPELKRVKFPSYSDR